MFRLARRYFRLWPATRDQAGDYTWDFLSFVCCTLLTLYSFPTLSSHLQTPARSLPCGGPNNLFNNFNLLKIPRQSERGCPGRRGDSLGSQTAKFALCEARQGMGWGAVVLYPALGPQKARRGNTLWFCEQLRSYLGSKSSLPEREVISVRLLAAHGNTLINFSSFVAHLLSETICSQHLARLPGRFHNNNTLHFSGALSSTEPRALYKH